MTLERGCAVLRSAWLWSLLLCCFAVRTQPALQLLTEHSPPGQYLDQQGRVSGVTVALIRHLQQQLNEPADIQLMPWGRAITLASSSDNTALFETVRNAKRESWFKWVGPLMHYNITLYGLQQRLGVDATKLQLPGKLIACNYRNAATVDDMKRLGFIEERNLILTSKTGECLNMLIAGRIDVMAITEYSLAEFSAQVQAAGFDFSEVKHLAERKSYLAFSTDISDARIARWQQALQQSYRDGTMRTLYQPVFPESIIQRLENFARSAR